MVKGKGAKSKGSAFERAVVSELKRIYPTARRKAVTRIPMSGAGSMKGDVLDQNDTQYCYECKKHERLSIPNWWRQTLSQTQVWQMPVLAFSSNYRPIYWVMRHEDWMYCLKVADTMKIFEPYGSGSMRDLYKNLRTDAPMYGYYPIEVNGDTLDIIKNEDYIMVRTLIWNNRQTQNQQ